MESNKEISDEELEREIGNIIMRLIDGQRISDKLQNEFDAMQELNMKVSEGVSSMQAMPIDGVINDDLLAIERFALAPLEESLKITGPPLQPSHMNDIAVAKAQLQARFSLAKDVVSQRLRKLQERVSAATEDLKSGSVFFQALKTPKDSTKIILGRSLIEILGQLNPDSTKAAIALGVLYHRARGKMPVYDATSWQSIQAWSGDMPYPAYVDQLIAGGFDSMTHVDRLARRALQAGSEGVEALDKLRGLLSKSDRVPLPLFNHTRRALTRAFDTVEETFHEERSASRINVNVAIVNPPSVVFFLHTIYQGYSVIHKLTTRIAESSESVVHSNCVYELGKLMKCGNLQALQALSKLLEHPDPYVCRAAVSRLCEAIPDFPVRCLTEILCRIQSIEKDPIMWEMLLVLVSDTFITFPPAEQKSTKEQVDQRVNELIGPHAAPIAHRFWKQLEEHQRTKPSTTQLATSLRRNLPSRRSGPMRQTGHRPEPSWARTKV